MSMDIIRNKRVLIVGLGVTGESVVRFLHAQQITFDVVDESSQPTQALQAYLTGATVHTVLDVSLCSQYDVLVISPGVPRSQQALKVAQANGVEIIGDIELFTHAIGDTPVIAVTGSNGKSTVVSWIAHVLEQCGKRAKLCGNIGTPALDSVDTDAEIYVLELSSYQLESTSSLKTISATVLNVSDDHMDRYASIEHYARVKRSVYRGCSHPVVNLDDKRTWVNQDQAVADGERIASTSNISTAFSLLGGVGAEYHVIEAANDTWLCCGTTKLIRRSQLQTPGNHNVANALAVIALLQPFKLEMNQLIIGISGFRGLEHRTEFVLERDGVRWYNDSKGTNIDACKKAIMAMNAPVILIAGGLGKGADFRALRHVVEQHVKALVLIGKDAALIRDALKGVAQTVMAESLEDAVSRGVELAVSGDVVLLSPACSSFDMFENFEQRGRMFKQAVEAIAA